MYFIQLLVALAILGGSASSNYATSTQMEIKSLQPQTASSDHIMESGLKPFRDEKFFKDLDPFEQAAENLREDYSTFDSWDPYNVGDTGTFLYGGQVKVLRTLPLNQSISIGPMTIHMLNVQLIEVSDIPKDTQKNISILNQEKIGPDMTYIKILYSIENTTDQNIGFYGLNSVHPNIGKPYSADRNFMRRIYGYHQYDGVVMDDIVNGYVFTEDPDQLESIELIFNKIYDYDTGETIVEPTSLTIPFTAQD
ncbi:MAG: hypothetical protein IKE29_22320 [Paenibacillus sp.]|uniref:hypothetical protein n=1 Tax=Paenibacillus sp. TaxID=58172 RepID=UPI0025DE602B|nr:hypothetical protein [Paenibacillus sp.]MBR2567330.1 hypothetical protein [Paenibacillus sp.]